MTGVSTRAVCPFTAARSVVASARGTTTSTRQRILGCATGVAKTYAAVARVGASAPTCRSRFLSDILPPGEIDWALKQLMPTRTKLFRYDYWTDMSMLLRLIAGLIPQHESTV